MPDAYADARAKLAEGLASTRLARAWTERRVTEQQKRRLVLRLVRSARRDLRGVTMALVAGSVSPGRWYRTMARGIAAVHTAAAMVSAGTARPSDAVRAAIDFSVQRQLGYLNRWYRQLKMAVSPLDGRAVSRAGLYANSAWGTAQNTLRAAAQVAGYRWEKRVLGPVDRHCRDCIEEAAKGWQPLGSLRPIGDTICSANCACSLIFRSELPPEPKIPAIGSAPVSQTIKLPTFGAGSIFGPRIGALRSPLPVPVPARPPASTSRPGLFHRAVTAVAGWVRRLFGR